MLVNLAPMGVYTIGKVENKDKEGHSRGERPRQPVMNLASELI